MNQQGEGRRCCKGPHLIVWIGDSKSSSRAPHPTPLCPPTSQPATALENTAFGLHWESGELKALGYSLCIGVWQRLGSQARNGGDELVLGPGVCWAPQGWLGLCWVVLGPL